MTNFKFNPSPHFVQPGYKQAAGDWTGDITVSQIEGIKKRYHEIIHWGNLAVGEAWGAYSQDIMAVNWIYDGRHEVAENRNLDFIAYIYVRQLAPSFDFGGTGLRARDIYELGLKQPWQGTDHVAPVWAVN